MKFNSRIRMSAAILGTLGLAVMLTALGSAATPKFLPDDPIWQEQDTADEGDQGQPGVPLPQLEAVNLHFHDLRHEAGCRWLEEGWPIHHVQEMLGHANLSQTSTYLHASETGLQDSMRRFDGARGKPVANQEAIEHPSVSHEETEATEKGTLH